MNLIRHRKPRDVLSLEDIAVKVGPIAHRYGVPKVYVYGSYARGEADSDSDIDLCIEWGDIRDYFELGHMETDLEDALGKDVDITTTGASKKFIDSIRKDMVLIYEGRQRTSQRNPALVTRSASTSPE